MPLWKPPLNRGVMRSLTTRLVVDPTCRSSPIHDWLSSELDQYGFDGRYTSRCVFNIVDRQVDSGPRIGSCPTMSLWAWDEADATQRPSSAAMSEVGRTGRRSWNNSTDEELKKEAIIDLLRLMVSTEVPHATLDTVVDNDIQGTALASERATVSQCDLGFDTLFHGSLLVCE